MKNTLNLEYQHGYGLFKKKNKTFKGSVVTNQKEFSTYLCGGKLSHGNMF